MDSFAFKILLLGDSGVGKTCTIIRYVDKRFYPMYHMTIGVEYNTVWETFVDDNDDDTKKQKYSVQLRLWDTAGQETFRSITQSYYRDALGIIFMYDKTSPETFQHIPSWKKEFLRHTNMKEDDVAMILVGNKCDLSSETCIVPTKEAQVWAEKNNMLFMEISAKQDICIHQLFQTLIQAIWKKQKEIQQLSRYKIQKKHRKNKSITVYSFDRDGGCDGSGGDDDGFCCWRTRASI